MKKLPQVTIVGYPNVGKSTLFNRLLRKKKSLVHSLPGMTRDWVSETCTIKDYRFLLVDTGGFFDFPEDSLSGHVKEKAWEASNDANILLFIVDGRRDLLPAEEELYHELKKLNKKILVLINKMDSVSDENKIGEYYRLGEENILAVSAEHKRNLSRLEEMIVEMLPAPSIDAEEEKSLKIAIVGRINVGKSSIVNRLCGQKKLIVSEIPGTTRDSTDTLIRREKKLFCLVDTAGIRKLSRTQDKREKAGIIKAKKDMTRADVICLVLDAQEFPTRQDTAIAHLAKESGKPLILVLNKWDLIPAENKLTKEYERKIFEKMDFVSYAPLLFISAVSGQRVVKILDIAENVYNMGNKRVTTSQLNEFLAWVNENHPAISKKKTRIKIKYMTQNQIFPPTFVLFTHSRLRLTSAYEKFFINLLRKKFDIFGTPIRVWLKRN